MHYDTTNLRRQDRALTEPEACRILQEGEYGILSLQAPEGGGYGVPMNYAWDGADFLYLHCAGEGFKLRCLQAQPKAGFVVIRSHSTLPEKFSTAYESVMLQGTCGIVTDEAEKRKALQLLIQQLTPGETARGDAYIDRALAATTVLRFRINSFCGKAHRNHTGSPA
ncbi:MAG: pyridoxamine 5'-phosphate oxidase family protein [Akkermansia sp.]|nr:pyridoxamine 5'-phosphate oxidase family protein [Akkermansia sp.]MBQ2869565.1 pyridoxamine 5'-phosphate oxidase family protein [Akkermansia sp.]MBQ8376377.1 pyridoxamine 5'-phosphate oxidase family protein [Akkermansia sp.]